MELITEPRVFAHISAEDVADHILKNVEHWNTYRAHKASDPEDARRHRHNAMLCQLHLKIRASLSGAVGSAA